MLANVLLKALQYEVGTLAIVTFGTASNGLGGEFNTKMSLPYNENENCVVHPLLFSGIIS